MRWERAIWRRPWRLKGPLLALAALLIALPAVGILAAVTEQDGSDAMAVIQMAGASMEPTFEEGQVLRVLEYENAPPERGDVIVFAARSPSEERGATFALIKRVIGLPGDRVEILPESGTVVVNGEVVDEPYAKGRTLCVGRCRPWLVPDEAYFVMGDNRQISTDSRQGWFVPEEDIIGRAGE